MSDLVQVVPVLDAAARSWCTLPYHGHPRGCPNYGKKPTCPPKAPLYAEVYDLSKPVYVVINEFDLGEHVEKLREKHPDWTIWQLRCCLYWQSGARKELRKKIDKALRDPRCVGYRASVCPEAMGVNVTDTVKQIGVELEWPPFNTVRQVALLGFFKPIGD